MPTYVILVPSSFLPVVNVFGHHFRVAKISVPPQFAHVSLRDGLEHPRAAVVLEGVRWGQGALKPPFSPPKQTWWAHSEEQGSAFTSVGKGPPAAKKLSDRDVVHFC